MMIRGNGLLFGATPYTDIEKLRCYLTSDTQPHSRHVIVWWLNVIRCGHMRRV